MKKTRIVIVEASIEKVPKKIMKHPAIQKDAKRRGRDPNKILLYLPIHYTALIKHKIPVTKRGRPDILHRILINILDHPLNKKGGLEIYFHTINDEIYWVNPEMRPPIHYYGFEGLMIQLLENGRVPPEGNLILIKRIDTKLDELMRENNRKVYALKKEGVKLTRQNLEKIYGETLVIGGFHKGEYRKDIMKLFDETISLYNETLKASTATCIALTMLYQMKNV